MSLLMQQYQSKLASQKDKRIGMGAAFRVAYPTNFLSFDFMNGTVVTVKNEEKGLDLKYNSIGIPDGSLVLLAGRSGCGKTTFAVQAAGAIVKPFPESFIIHEDIEGGILDTRLEQLANLGDEFYEKYSRRDQGITTENFYEKMKILHDMKLENADKFQYDTGLYDSKGNKIFKLQPTVVILDSWAMLTPEQFTEENELSGSMGATSSVKRNTAMIRKVIQFLKPANIILLVINHILDDVNISIVPKKAQVAWLKPGERLPGGNTVIYLSNNIIKFNDNTKLKSEKEFGIDGICVDLEFIKSRAGAPGKAVTLILDYAKGFDNDLSLYMLLKQKGKIKGAGAYFYIDGLDTVKFSQKKFKEKLYENPELMQHFATVVLETLNEEIINSHSSKAVDNMLDKEKESQDMSSSNTILSMMNAQMQTVA